MDIIDELPLGYIRVEQDARTSRLERNRRRRRELLHTAHIGRIDTRRRAHSATARYIAPVSI